MFGSDIVIKDNSTGESRVFTSTNEGYAQAAAYRDSVTQQGHRVEGDLGRLDIAGYKSEHGYGY